MMRSCEITTAGWPMDAQDISLIGKLPLDEALILDVADGRFATLVFTIPDELLARIEIIGGEESFRCPNHRLMVLNYLLELGTSAKEAELEALAGQEELF